MSPVDDVDGRAQPPPADGEARWIALAAAGDAAAFAALVRLHQGRVRQQLRRLTHGNDALADDLAQDSFVQAWTHLPSFRGDARFSTWLYSIAHSRFLMHQRSPAARERATAVSLDALTDDHGVDGVHPPQQPAADVPAMRHDLHRAIAQLSEAEQRALYHCYQLDLTHQEAAAVLQWPLGTLKSHVERAKTRLRTLLAAWAPETTR